MSKVIAHIIKVIKIETINFICFSFDYFRYHFRFLEKVLERYIFSIDGFSLRHMSKEERDRAVNETRSVYESYRKEIRTFFKGQHKYLNDEIESIAQEISRDLNTSSIKEEISDVKKHFSSALEPDCAWKDATVKVRSDLYSSITRQIKKWETESKKVDELGKTITDNLHNNFPKFKNKIKKLENNFRVFETTETFVEENETFIPKAFADKFNSLSLGLRFLFGFGTSPVLLIGFLLRIPWFGIKQLYKEGKSASIKRTFKDNREEALKTYIKNIMESVLNPEKLAHLMKKELSPLFEYIDREETELKHLINSDLDILQKMEDEEDNEEDHMKAIIPIRRELLDLLHRLKYFKLMEVPIDISPFKSFSASDLKVVDKNPILSDGFMSTISVVTMQKEQGGKYEHFLLKKCKIRPTRQNISDIMDELAIVCR